MRIKWITTCCFQRCPFKTHCRKRASHIFEDDVLQSFSSSLAKIAALRYISSMCYIQSSPCSRTYLVSFRYVCTATVIRTDDELLILLVVFPYCIRLITTQFKNGNHDRSSRAVQFYPRHGKKGGNQLYAKRCLRRYENLNVKDKLQGKICTLFGSACTCKIRLLSMKTPNFLLR